MGCPSGNQGLDPLGIGPILDDLFPDLEADLVDQPEKIPFSGLCIGTQDEIGSRQGIKVEGMAMDIVGGIEEFPELLRRSWRIRPVNSVYGLTRGQMVRRGSDAADAGDDPGKFLYRSPLAEDLEPS